MHVAVTSEQTLVSQAIAAALSHHGIRASILGWPRTRSPVPLPRAPIPAPFDAGLLLSNLDQWARVRAARSVMTGVATRWVVLTEAPRGPVWGAALTYGAVAVLPIDAPLNTVVAVLEQTAHSDRLMPTGEVGELREQWTALAAYHEQTLQRFGSLTPREREVLWHLYRGDSVAQIALKMSVSLSTVRSQVKSILRKLRVNNQLAAVAAMRDYLELDPPRVPPGDESEEFPSLGIRS